VLFKSTRGSGEYMCVYCLNVYVF